MKMRRSQTARLGMIAAFRWEVSALLRRQRNVVRLGTSRFGFLMQGNQAVLAIAGAGAENAYLAAGELIRDFSPAGVISIGFAGGLQEIPGAGELLVAKEIIEERSGQYFPCQKDLLALQGAVLGSLLSAAAVVNSAESKRALATQWNALAVDLESSGVARAAKENGVALGAIKSITDASDQSISIDFQRCRSEDGGLSTWKIVREGMTSPQGVRDLWRLAGSSRRAAGKLALALCSIEKTIGTPGGAKAGTGIVRL